MRALRFVALLLYTGYLVYMGLAMLLLPWTDAWATLAYRLAPAWGAVLDAPSLRGAVSAFGLLHLLLVVLEMAAPRRRRS